MDNVWKMYYIQCECGTPLEKKWTGPSLEHVDSETDRLVMKILQLLVSGQELSKHCNNFVGKTFRVVLPRVGW
jgi:hypothetical protein